MPHLRRRRTGAVAVGADVIDDEVDGIADVPVVDRQARQSRLDEHRTHVDVRHGERLELLRTAVGRLRPDALHGPGPHGAGWRQRDLGHLAAALRAGELRGEHVRRARRAARADEVRPAVDRRDQAVMCDPTRHRSLPGLVP
jgi:hypothetical protein